MLLIIEWNRYLYINELDSNALYRFQIKFQMICIASYNTKMNNNGNKTKHEGKNQSQHRAEKWNMIV